MDYLHYKGYYGSVEYSEEDNCLFGKILGLKNSLILYEGSSLEELKKDFETSVENYLFRYINKEIQHEKICNKMFNILIPNEIHNKAMNYAKNHGTTIDDFICESIERRLEAVI